jgi:magnesium-protoporphyrin IX monomethyl ester (oxidative) cyclase
MLLPPQELMALGGILREMDGCNAKIVDCIADNLDMAQTLNELSILNPDLIVSIQGFECFEEDMDALDIIKKNFPHIKLILFGHYATLFPADILSKTKVDIIILGEPDVIFESIVSSFLQGSSLEAVEGIAYRTESGITIQKGDERIIHPERLPMPAYELISIDKYYESFSLPLWGLHKLLYVDIQFRLANHTCLLN